jgi:mono/diheme cytochrome c family protein
MAKLLKILLVSALLLVLLAVGGFGWARWQVSAVTGRTIETHSVDFPIPFPLDSAEVAAAGLTPEEAGSVAQERALERGRHLLESRYACMECHGADLGGGVMVDDPAMGRLLGSNLTEGRGSRTAGYAAADWDRMVRHGVKPDGHPTFMPAEEFRLMSDQELSDIVTYIRSLPPVDAEVEPVSLGPLGTVLVALGKIPMSADRIGEHRAPHPVEPPPAEANAEFGRHLAAPCSGCHGAALAGGPVPGGPPGWPPAANLTPHADGIADWSYEDFVTSIEAGTRPDGSEIREPMTLALPFLRRMTETEVQALWAYLRSLPPTPTGG